MLGVAIGFLAILALALFYIRSGLNSALAPLASLSTVVLVLLPFGFAGVLNFGAVFLLVACFALGIYSFVKMGFRAVWNAVGKSGFIVFVVLCFMALFWFGLRQPVFSQWDEFSFWGTSVKMMKLQGELYTTAEAGWFWTATEMPAMPLLSWFMQFLSGEFLPWAVFFAYASLIFACVCAMIAQFEKNIGVFVSLAIIGALLPFFFLSPVRITALSPAYLIAYGDLPAGLWFGGALAFYLCLRRKKQVYWALLPLAGFALVKDNTFSIALVAGGLMLCDALFIAPKPEVRLKKGKRVELRWAFLAVPIAVYMAWRTHTGYANTQNVVTQGEATGASPIGAVQSTLLELFGFQPRSEAFTRALTDMTDVFVSGAPVSMLGSALVNSVVILSLFLLAFLLSKHRTSRIQVALWGVLSTLGFLGFQFVLLTYYAFLSKYDGGVPDYTRYQISYFAGWLIVALCLLAQGAIEGASEVQTHEEVVQSEHKTIRNLAAQTVVIFLGFGAMLLFALNILDGYSVLDFPDNRYDILRVEQAEMQALGEEMEPDARVFYVNQNDTGFGWFKTHYYLMPHRLDYSFGGGRIVPQATGESGEIELSAEEFEAYLEEADCNYILIDELDEGFVHNYGHLFTDNLSGVQDVPVLYERVQSGLYTPA